MHLGWPESIADPGSAPREEAIAEPGESGMSRDCNTRPPAPVANMKRTIWSTSCPTTFSTRTPEEVTMPRQGPRFIVAMLACAMTVGCTQDSPLGSSDPVTPPRTDLLRSAVRIHVDLVQGTAVAVSPDARTATAAGLSLALVG